MTFSTLTLKGGAVTFFLTHSVKLNYLWLQKRDGGGWGGQTCSRQYLGNSLFVFFWGKKNLTGRAESPCLPFLPPPILSSILQIKIELWSKFLYHTDFWQGLSNLKKKNSGTHKPPTNAYFPTRTVRRIIQMVRYQIIF